MKHGGDILSYKHLYKGEIVDFSSNINPRGPPEGLRSVLTKAFEDINKYPDIKYRRLKEEISQYLGCSEGEVILGNGAVEIINNLSMMFSRIVVYTPCFAEYIERPKIFNKDILTLSLTDEFCIDEKALDSHIKKGDLVILGNPNNPTGKRIGRDKLKAIHEIIVKKEGFLLLDEAFYEFCPDDYDSIELFSGSKNLCVIRAATKFFSLPGIRLGYACMNQDMAEKYNKLSLPWNINTFADIAGRYIFRDKEFIRKSKYYINSQRNYMLEEFNKIKGIKVFNSDTNFILIKLLDTDEDYIFDALIKKGILIRKASSFEGLDKSFIRVAVKDLENNSKLIKNIKECLEWKA